MLLILPRWWFLCKPFVRKSIPQRKIQCRLLSDSWVSYAPSILDEFNFKQAAVKGLVTINVAYLSTVTSTCICYSFSESVKNGLHTSTQFWCLCWPWHCDYAAICFFLWMVNCIRNGERAALQKSVPWLWPLPVLDGTVQFIIVSHNKTCVFTIVQYGRHQNKVNVT